MPGIAANQYWVMLYAKGIGLLSEDQPGVWSFTAYPIGPVTDITGPDSTGRLFCASYGSIHHSHVLVFDTNNRQVIANIILWLRHSIEWPNIIPR